MTDLVIGERRIGPGHPPYLIADIGANHDGSLERALHLVDLAAQSGAHAAKFQNFQAATIVSRRGFDELPKMAHQAGWKTSVYEAYERASIALEWTEPIVERCAAAGIEYLTTPYALELVDAVDPYLHAIKIGSGDVTWLELLRHVATKGKPVLLATGASTLDDVDRALAALEGAPGVALLQCNTNYTGDTANLGYVNLRVLQTFGARYPDAVLGLSDHTPGHVTAVAAVALGARVIEKHFTDDNDREGPDHGFAMTPATWRAMAEAVAVAYEALGDGVKRVEPNEEDAAVVQRRALRYARHLPAGHRLEPGDLHATRPIPAGALEPYRAGELVGHALVRPVEADELAHVADVGAS
jgi:N-acetylneuraminate synthase